MESRKHLLLMASLARIFFSIFVLVIAQPSPSKKLWSFPYCIYLLSLPHQSVRTLAWSSYEIDTKENKLN